MGFPLAALIVLAIYLVILVWVIATARFNRKDDRR